MGFFSGIAEGFKNAVNSVIDSSLNIVGKIMDYGGRGGVGVGVGGGGVGGYYTEYEDLEGDIIDEWVDWIFDFDS